MGLFWFYQVTHPGSITTHHAAPALNATPKVSEGNGCIGLKILKQRKRGGAVQTESKQTKLIAFK